MTSKTTDSKSSPHRDPVLRDHDRIPVTWRATIRCATWETAERVATTNISKGGMFLRTDKDLPVGSKVEITLQLPDGVERSFLATVRHITRAGGVASSDCVPGVGIEVDPTLRDELKAITEIARDEQSKPHFQPNPVAPMPTHEKRSSLPEGRVAGIVGVDLGMSFSSVAVAVDGVPRMVPNAQGLTQLPTIVAFPPESSPLLGWEAIEGQILYPDRTITSAKRLLGRDFSDHMVAGYLFALPLVTMAGPDSMILIEIDGEKLAVTQICALLLEHLRKVAEEGLGGEVRRAVFTCPVTFGEVQKKALSRAAKIAGFEPAAIIEEPVAGALAYGLGREEREVVAVYDFGGGTFDFSVLELEGKDHRVLVSKGDAWLGGDDFDRLLAEAVANGFWQKTHIELRDRQVEWGKLMMGCEAAKRQLSTEMVTKLMLRNILQTPRPLDLEQRIDRDGLRYICMGLFEQSIEICREALAEISLEPADVQRVIATGGTSRIPFIRQGLEQFFERRISDDVDPQEAVPLGAAAYAAWLEQEEG